MVHQYQDTGERARILKNCRRIVIKVGTQLLTGLGAVSEADRIDKLVGALTRVRGRELDVILVSSGAIGAGMAVLGTSRRPTSLPLLQAHAAVGQSRLMYHYETACANHGFHCAQLLLTAADVQHRERHLNVTSCLDALLCKGVLPVINENDSVSVDEIRFGDNDILAALVATMAHADLTVILTKVDGMHERGGSNTGRRLSVIPKLTDAVRGMAGGTDGNPLSVGGMTSKLRAAELLMKAGENLWIADGRDFGVLDRILAGEDIGTLFLAASSKMASHKRFLAFFSGPAGELVVDPGAATAVAEKGRSLLPSGIVEVRGSFERGDTVRILDLRGVEIAKGVTNYGAVDATRIRGAKSHDVGRILGTAACYEEVVHRNYLVLTR
ncbi:MAG: glutamate 5-kinase [Lentisphaerae bacterium RIFOXYB12_FULL_65_16]|nr:MAG: glutamate 5-kinase [Lentisphaerae bacterium RIFOXYA12_64_32]OGV90318.1 MAG: glutamate 5-kinase [Lentisphaerae bacterium RIFOXYB12_FULL_65_16]